MHYGRKVTGGKYHKFRKRKSYENRNKATLSTLGEPKRKVVRVRGGNSKTQLLKANEVNIIVDKKVQKAKIINVMETPQNRFLSRQNVLAKGAIIETSVGKARITNRPAKEGHVNAILVK